MTGNQVDLIIAYPDRKNYGQFYSNRPQQFCTFFSSDIFRNPAFACVGLPIGCAKKTVPFDAKSFAVGGDMAQVPADYSKSPSPYPRPPRKHPRSHRRFSDIQPIGRLPRKSRFKSTAPVTSASAHPMGIAHQIAPTPKTGAKA